MGMPGTRACGPIQQARREQFVEEEHLTYFCDISLLSWVHPKTSRKEGVMNIKKLTTRKLMTRTVILGPVLAAMLGTGILIGCAGDTEHEGGRETNRTAVTQVISEQGGGESGGEHGGSSGESGSESDNEAGGAEAGEAAMSSPIIPLGQTWTGVLGGLAVDARYDAATRSVQSTVRNTLSQTLCYVQAEPHLKSGTTTVGELGPDVMGHLSPGQTATTSVSVDSEPGLAGVSYDGYVVHLEVFDCAGTGPVPHTGGEGGEGGGGEGAGSEEGSANQLAPDEIFDEVRGGARLVLGYDAASNAFKGTVENTTSNVLTRVRIEVHLSNGTELGPTTPVDMAPGQALQVDLPSTQAPFTGWIAHAEVGGGESGGEGGGEHGSGSESGGEHGGGRESGGEHGGRGESGGGEHGGRGESRGSG